MHNLIVLYYDGPHFSLQRCYSRELVILSFSVLKEVKFDLHICTPTARVFRESVLLVLYSSTAAEHSWSNALILHDVISQPTGRNICERETAAIHEAARAPSLASRRIGRRSRNVGWRAGRVLLPFFFVILWIWCEKTTAVRDGKKLWRWSENILFEIQMSQLPRFRFHRFPNKRSLHLAAHNFSNTTVQCHFVCFPGTFDLSYPFLFFFCDRRRERRGGKIEDLRVSLLRLLCSFQLIDNTDLDYWVAHD